MTDAVATIRVAPGKTLWSADEVPRLTASALFEFIPEPDPEIAQADLRRFTALEARNGGAGRALSGRELGTVARACKAAGLPTLPERLTASKWGEYLEAGNADADARGWLVGFIPPRDPNQGARLAWVIAAEEHRKLLKQAIATGTINPRLAGTLVPAQGASVALERLVLTRGELEKFAALIAMAVTDVPGNEPSEPVAVGPRYDLLATPDDLVAAFGSFTGMTVDWFSAKGVKESKPLQAARKVAGVGGNRPVPPLFCPFEVLLWLLNPRTKRRGADRRPLSETTGWRIFESHFPRVYAEHRADDPRSY